MKASRLGRFLISLLIVLSLARLGVRVTTGLSAEYFTNERFGGTPAWTTIDRQLMKRRIIANWAGDVPERFSVRWQGYLTVPEAGTYSFHTRSDDGSRVTIGDALVVNNSGEHAPVDRSGEATLDAGAHRVLVEYEQLGGGYDFELTSSIPAWRFTPQRVPGWRLQAAHVLDAMWTGAFVSAVAWAIWILPLHAGALITAIKRRPRMAALLFFVALTAVETWPFARHPGRLSRNDNNDTILNEWTLAWIAHEAPRSPLDVSDANIFHPERDTLAYSELMMEQAVMAAPLLWFGASPVFAYNIVLLAGFALTGWSMCLVMREWTGHWEAGLLSGVLAAFNAYTLTNLPHLQSVHVEFLAPALFALDALLREPHIGQAVRLAVWFVLQALTSVYLLVFSALALAIGALVRPDAWHGDRFRRVAGLAALAAAVAAVALLPYLLPYWRVYHVQGFSRTIDWQARLSAIWQDYLTTPGRIHYALWGSSVFANYGLFPGMTATALTAVSMVRRIAWTNPRARMCLAFGIAGVVLSFGPSVPGYTALYNVLPPLHAIRAVGRFGFLALFALAALAGFGLAELRRMVPAPQWTQIARVAIALAAIEPFAAPLELMRADPVSPIYARVADEPGAVVAELPFYGGGEAHAHAAYMRNSTLHWKPMINGYSGVEPQSFVNNVQALGGFPDERSVSALKEAGVTHVFVHVGNYGTSVIQSIARFPELRELESLDGIILYRLER